jgi:4-amino-4-deoxy-L-arabinose transferase-like glycosyltransferase
MRTPATRAIQRVLTPARLALGLLLFGAYLRFYGIQSSSLWLDEIFAADTTRLKTLADVYRWATTDPQEMPMINFIAWFLQVLGDGEWVVRLPAALAGSFSVLAMYATGKAMGRPRIGLIAAFLMAVSPFAVAFSQEARPYSFLMLFTTLQMLFAYRAVRLNRARDWGWLALCTVLNIYSHYLALTVTLASFIFVGLVLFVEILGVGKKRAVGALGRALIVRRRSWAHRRGRSSGLPYWGSGPIRVVAWPEAPSLVSRWIAVRIAAACATVAAIAAAYYPWLPNLFNYLNGSGIASGSNVVPPVATLAGLSGLLDGLGFPTLVLVVMTAGVLTIFADLWRSRWRETTLVIIWLAVPLSAFWYVLGSGMVTVFPRYFSCLVPAGVLLTAIGVDGIATAAATRIGPWRLAWTGATSAFVASGIVIVLLTQMVPGLGRVYAARKDDYRGVADYVIANSTGDSMVIAMGGCATYVVKSIPYYFRIRHSSILVIDGALLDDRALAALQQSKAGTVWGLVFSHCNPADNEEPIKEAMSAQGEIEVVSFPGLELVRQSTPSKIGTEQALAVLNLGMGLSPTLGASIRLVTAFSGTQRIGDDVLIDPPSTDATRAQTLWNIPPNVALSRDRQSFVFQLNEVEDTATRQITGTDVVPGATYLMSFEYRNTDFEGAQKIYVSTHNLEGVWTATFPDGAGYTAKNTEEWTRGMFALTVPQDTVMIQVWLRGNGVGVVEFRSVTLRLLE